MFSFVKSSKAIALCPARQPARARPCQHGALPWLLEPCKFVRHVSAVHAGHSSIPLAAKHLLDIHPALRLLLFSLTATPTSYRAVACAQCSCFARHLCFISRTRHLVWYTVLNGRECTAALGAASATLPLSAAPRLACELFSVCPALSCAGGQHFTFGHTACQRTAGAV